MQRISKIDFVNAIQHLTDSLGGKPKIKDVADYQTNADKTIEQALAFKAGVAVAYSGVVGKIELA